MLSNTELAETCQNWGQQDKSVEVERINETACSSEWGGHSVNGGR